MGSEIETHLIEYIRTKILKRTDYTLEPEDRLISTGLVDSFHMIDLALFVEEQFGVRIDDTELNSDTFDTIAELAELILKKQK